VCAQLDAFFNEYMQLYSECRAARVEAHAALSAGFFSLSSARHALPSMSLDSSAYSGRPMLPLVAVAARPAFPLPPGEVQPKNLQQLETPVAFELVDKVPLKDVVADEDEEQQSGEQEDEDDAPPKHDSAAEGVRKRPGKGAKEEDAAPAAASATAAGAADASAASASAAAPAAASASAAAAPAAVDLRRTPLAWFGVLAPSALSDAASSFRTALSVLVGGVASRASRMAELERKFAALSALQQASHVDPAVEEQLTSILAKIKISDERKHKYLTEQEEAQKAAQPAAASAAAGASSASEDAAAPDSAAAAAAEKQ
jgi:hypothetical protein